MFAGPRQECPQPSDKGLQTKAPPGSPSTGISLLEPKRFGVLLPNKLFCLFVHYFLFLSSSFQEEIKLKVTCACRNTGHVGGCC